MLAGVACITGRADAALAHVPCAERAAVKSYSLRKQDGGQDQFVAYLLPLDEPRGADEAGPSRCVWLNAWFSS